MRSRPEFKPQRGDMSKLQEITSSISVTLSDADWAKISLAGRLSDDFRESINKAFAGFKTGRASDMVSPETIDLTDQIQGRITHLSGLIKKLALNDEYRLARGAPELPKPNLALLNQSLEQFELLSIEMHSAQQRLSGIRNFDIEDPLIDFFFGLMCIQANCLKQSPPTSESSSGIAYKYILSCAELVEPGISQRRRFAPAFRKALRMFGDLRTSDPDNWPHYFDGSPIPPAECG